MKPTPPGTHDATTQDGPARAGLSFGPLRFCCRCGGLRDMWESHGVRWCKTCGKVFNLLDCPHPRFVLHGYDRRGERRFRCKDCGKTWTDPDAPCRPFWPMRIPVAKCVAFLQHIEAGFSSRQSADFVHVNHNTGTRLLRIAGVVRRCRACGEPLTGNRFRFCRDECQEWRTRSYHKARDPIVPLFGATANVLRRLQSSGHDRHTLLAWEFAQEISERNAAEYFGPCYEGVIRGCQEDVTAKLELQELAIKSVKAMWKETKAWGRSLDEIKDSVRWESASCPS